MCRYFCRSHSCLGATSCYCCAYLRAVSRVPSLPYVPAALSGLQGPVCMVFDIVKLVTAGQHVPRRLQQLNCLGGLTLFGC
jgi:hypothetical protein